MAGLLNGPESGSTASWARVEQPTQSLVVWCERLKVLSTILQGESRGDSVERNGRTFLWSRIVTNEQLSFSPQHRVIGLDFESIRPGNKDFESVALVFLRFRFCIGRAQDHLQSFALSMQVTPAVCPLLALKNTHRYHCQVLDSHVGG
jgi:hypothetical protein